MHMWFHSQLEKNSLTISKLKMPRAHMQALLFTLYFFLDAVKIIRYAQLLQSHDDQYLTYLPQIDL